MTHDLRATIRLLGKTREYSDGAEDKVLSVFENVLDRSDGSDDLRRHALDWPTTYHFSPRRANLLRPIEIRADMRILEVGAGTGALTRYLGERGASVVAIEGDPTRTLALSLRCADLDNVEVICGVLGQFEDPVGFDLVVVVGVLEYAGGDSPGQQHHIEFLSHTAALVKPDGALVLAIENQIGLKYLLGYAEDHLAEPWSGVADYPGNPPIRTFSRKVLRTLLERCGLTAQRWFFPFPDYKLPTAILSEELFDHPNATEIIDQLVGAPVQDLANPPTRFCDDRAAHRVFLTAGLGQEVANSFLVMAARRKAVLDPLVDRQAIAWHFSSERRKHLRRHQVIHLGSSGLAVASEATFADQPKPESAWLSHDPHKDEPFVLGQTMEQQAIEANKHRDVDALARVLTRWRSTLQKAYVPSGTANTGVHPFAGPASRETLPPEYLDVGLSNFVEDTGDPVFVDREWLADAGVDAELVQFRALWYFATELVVSGIDHSFDSHLTIDELAGELARLAGFDPGDELFERFFSAEAKLQEIVVANDAESAEKELREIGGVSRNDRKAAHLMPIHSICRDVITLNATVGTLAAEAEEARAHHTHLESTISRAVLRAAELESTLIVRDRLHDAVAEELEKTGQWALKMEAELGHAQRWADELTDRLNEKKKVELELRLALSEEQQIERDRRAGLEAEINHLETTIGELGNSCAQYEETLKRPLVRAALAIDRLFDGSDPNR